MTNLKYGEFAHNIDIDAFEEAIGFEPMYRQGENDVGKCVFPNNHKHGDETGKFAIHRGKKLYNCFVCEGGTLLSLVMEMYGFELDEATRWLAQFTKSDARSDDDFIDEFLSSLEDEKKKTSAIPYFNDKVLDKFTDDTSWFITRGISQDVIDEYRLRFTSRAMRAGPSPDKDDYYGPSAIFPHFWNGRLVGWQNRWMDWDRKHTKTPKWLAKYTNTRDFPKTTTIFNYSKALEFNGPVIVCESIPTVLMLVSIGQPAVAYFGGNITPEQLKLLRRFKKLILAPDNDEKGDSFLEKASPYLRRYTEVLHLPKVTSFGVGGDLGDFATKYEGDELKRRVFAKLMDAREPGMF